MKKRGKQKGIVDTVVSMFFLIFAVLLIAYMLQIYQFNATRTFTEDALAASNLASAVIDIQEYGITHNIVIADPQAAYETYKRALRTNMMLDDDWYSQNTLAISGQVEILDYVVYNVVGQDVQITSFGQNPYITTITGGLGSVSAPNGIQIESTSVYSRITFPVEGILGVSAVAEKDKLVDIVGGQL